jgi:hypothetical protein
MDQPAAMGRSAIVQSLFQGIQHEAGHLQKPLAFERVI